MKYLLVLAVVWIGYHFWRQGRLAEQAKASSTQSGKPMAMVACAHCGTHLPASEALTHQGRAYCCAEHRDAA